MDFQPVFEHIPKHFAKDGDILMSHQLAMMSGSFPAGEEYYIESVRHFRDEITDPVLKAQVAGFIGQEKMHSRQHDALNAHLASFGYRIDTIDRVSRKINAVRKRRENPLRDLAETAAAEHLTATMAEIVLRNPDLAVEAAMGVILWHALEECEHKAVAFDVYRAIGGSERERIRAGRLRRYTMWAVPFMAVASALLTDPAIRRPGALLASWRRFQASPLTGKEVRARLKEFERPGFHPNDRDTDALLEEWRERLFGAGGSLSEALVLGKSA